jgi:hypothetical protein
LNDNRVNNRKLKKSITQNHQIIIEHRFINKTDAISIVKYAEKKISQYNKIYCIYDYKKNLTESSYKDASLKEINKDIERIKSCPSYEFWLFLHFSCNIPIFTDDQDLIKQLKTHIPGYQKKTLGEDVFKKLIKNLDQAIKRAKKIDDELSEEDKIPRKSNASPPSFTEIYKLIEDFKEKLN